ncbi:carbohydrate binding family 9 domain-containing protein [Thermaurantimonas aggregans]|uniref:carbohydrate binding family 9 domain-containing protein n=1 Tax=Thermaurantimonas aggregans TaxID=2173829 RepID=UPI000F565F7A|nr:carbohydrate binding family 9 domain-containing protein [Thermaurantimonas aggregans]
MLSILKRVTWITLFLFFLKINGQSLKSQYINEPIKVDGKLSESVWEGILQPLALTQRELFEGKPSEHKTWIGIAHDAQNLYIAIRCEQPRHTITAYELARDFNVQLDDVFYILIDTYYDKRNAFVFYTNPRGARGDYQVFDNGKATNLNWNTVWDVKTSIDSAGWTAEFVIPFISLRFESKSDSTIWGINFERNIRYLREQSLWMGWKRDSRLNLVTNAGQIHLSNVPNSKKFTEFKPYGISGVGGQRNGENSLNWRSLVNAGLDINYLINASYRLNISLNTDFAQIESDRQQVNLTRFPLFFPELREFFLEGQDFFDMGFGGDRIIPFYTRRIGLDSNYQPIPILAGVRLLGKSKGTTLGAMSIQTAKTNNAIAENFSAFSMRKDLGIQSTVGGMTILRINENYQHTTTGVNFRYSTSHFLGSKNLNIGGALVGTATSQTALNNENFAYRFFVQYPNDKFNIFLSTQQAGRNFSPKVGLMRREDFNEYFAIINYQPRPNPNGRWKWIRQFVISPGSVTLTRINEGNRLQTFQYSFSPIGLETRSGESIYLYATRHAEGIFVPFRIFANTIIEPGEYWFTRYSAELSTFRGRKIWFSGNYSIGQLFDGRSTDVSVDVNVRTSRFIQFTLLNTYSQGMFQQSGFDVLLTSLRVRYAFNPNTFGFILAQYNSATQEYLMNYRLQWIPFPGADFFFIANQTLRPLPDRGLTTASVNVMGKLIWRFVM